MQAREVVVAEEVKFEGHGRLWGGSTHSKELELMPH